LLSKLPNLYSGVFLYFSQKMKITSFLNSDLDSLSQIQPADWPDIRIPIAFYIEADYCFPFKFEIEGVLVGIGTAILHEKTGWLATIVTHNDYRKQGNGKLITEYLVAFLKEHNCQYIYLIATAQGEPVYSKVGFITESRYEYYKDIDLNELPISEKVKIYKSMYKDAIFELDRSISGENRSQHLETFLHDSFVYIENEKLEGVYFPRLGDGLIVAQTAKAGTELMKKRFQTFSMASFPEENLDAHNFMKVNGYEPVMTHARMHFGKYMPWQAAKLYNRVGGNIG
jgi:GNAT superfamily N-acetyltransferase